MKPGIRSPRYSDEFGVAIQEVLMNQKDPLQPWKMLNGMLFNGPSHGYLEIAKDEQERRKLPPLAAFHLVRGSKWSTSLLA